MAVVRAKKWGNSLAVIIPRSLAKEKRIRPGDEVVIDIDAARTPQRATWGLGKGRTKKTIQQLLDEDREDA